GADGVVKTWDAATGQQRASLAAQSGSLAFSPDGATLALGGYHRITERHINDHKSAAGVLLWEFGSGKAPVLFGSHSGEIAGVSFAPKDRILATASTDGTACL